MFQKIIIASILLAFTICVGLVYSKITIRKIQCGSNEKLHYCGSHYPRSNKCKAVCDCLPGYFRSHGKCVSHKDFSHLTHIPTIEQLYGCKSPNSTTWQCLYSCRFIKLPIYVRIPKCQRRCCK